MKSAPTALPETPPNGLTCGIDWARDDHAVSVVDAAGRQMQRFTVAHTDAALTGLTNRLTGHGVAEVAIERPDGPVVDALRGAGCDHRGGDQPEPAEEPAIALRLGRQQAGGPFPRCAAGWWWQRTARGA